MAHSQTHIKRNRAIRTLTKFFEVPWDTFGTLSSEVLEEWATQVRRPGYKLNVQQHNFLIGQGYN